MKIQVKQFFILTLLCCISLSTQAMGEDLNAITQSQLQHYIEIEAVDAMNAGDLDRIFLGLHPQSPIADHVKKVVEEELKIGTIECSSKILAFVGQDDEFVYVKVEDKSMNHYGSFSVFYEMVNLDVFKKDGDQWKVWISMPLTIKATPSFTKPDSPAVEPTGEILNYGIYGKKEPKIVNDPLELKQDTRSIPSRIGVFFAFQYEFRGLPDGEVSLDFSVEHPPMVQPNGKISTGGTERRRVRVFNGVAEGVSGYVFEHDYELVTGKWSFSYSYEGKVLIKQDFIVYSEKGILNSL